MKTIGGITRRQFSSVVALVLASALARADVAQASPAPAASAPIEVTSCQVTEIEALENPRLGIRDSYVDRLIVNFRDTAAVGATSVRIQVRYGALTKTIVEAGAFAPQQTVSRTSSALSAVWSGPTVTCTPVAATFNDGSTWMAAPAP